MKTTLYKRNAKGTPIYWSVEPSSTAFNQIIVCHGILDKTPRYEYINTNRSILDAIQSLINAKRKEGYKELQDLYDNAPVNTSTLSGTNLYNYLNTYLPKFNTHADGNFIPMLCKTLEDNKPFEKGSYFGQWKINGERCIITASIERDLFEQVKLHYRSREGVDWTDKLKYMDDYILKYLPQELLNMMIEEGVGLDGELYVPGYSINEINSFIKNVELTQHYQLQYWCYDICIENVSAIRRSVMLHEWFHGYYLFCDYKRDHYSNEQRFVILPEWHVDNIQEAIHLRDKFIDLGFEGLVIRKTDAEYQFGGKRNNSMLKFKKIEDGWFTIVDVVPEGIKRANLGKLVLQNDINEELFECSYNASHTNQEEILRNKDVYIGRKALVEYRERSGIKQCPFHARAIKIMNYES